MLPSPCSLPRAMYLSLEDKGSVFSILKNWPERRIKVGAPTCLQGVAMRSAGLSCSLCRGCTCQQCTPCSAGWVGGQEGGAPAPPLQAICLTDGQSVGHLGDLGVQVRA